jgi:hypothetical protein
LYISLGSLARNRDNSLLRNCTKALKRISAVNVPLPVESSKSLLSIEKPDATKVARLRTWNSLGRFVKRGEKGILILAPMIGCKKADSAAERTEDARQPQAQLYGFRTV